MDHTVLPAINGKNLTV